jgi:uncharacterized C2H2 Zn-finger protein
MITMGKKLTEHEAFYGEDKSRKYPHGEKVSLNKDGADITWPEQDEIIKCPYCEKICATKEKAILHSMLCDNRAEVMFAEQENIKMGKKVPCKNIECEKLLGVRDVVKVEMATLVKTVTLECPRCDTVTIKHYDMKKVIGG